MKELKLSEIWIYPVKSLGGIQLQSSKVLGKGLAHDRRWMLVDEQGRFMTQRAYPQMALFKLSKNEQHFTIRYQNHTQKLTDKTQSHAELVTVWQDSIMAHEVSREDSEWFSDMLQVKCKLVFFPEENERLVDHDYAISQEHVSLADAFPFLIIGQSSLDHLNKKLAQPVPMNRFRPNLVFTGGEPHEEDKWNNLTVGENRFAAVKLCSRCALPTVNQDTGEKSAEPLKTLSTYRTMNNKIYFGQNLIAIDHKEINIGDTVTVMSYQ